MDKAILATELFTPAEGGQAPALADASKLNFQILTSGRSLEQSDGRHLFIYSGNSDIVIEIDRVKVGDGFFFFFDNRGAGRVTVSPRDGGAPITGRTDETLGAMSFGMVVVNKPGPGLDAFRVELASVVSGGGGAPAPDPQSFLVPTVLDSGFTIPNNRALVTPSLKITGNARLKIEGNGKLRII